LKPSEKFQLASAVSKTNIRDDWKGCPENSSCISKGYLIPGDEIIVGKQEEGWVCAWYFGKKREFVGWLPLHSIKFVAHNTNPSLQEWIGTWKPNHNWSKIKIKMAKQSGYVSVSGNAVWKGGRNTAGYEIVHTGEFDGMAKPKGQSLIIKTDDDKYACVVKMTLVEKYLVISDNGNCGGMNVRFNEVLRRSP
jgi:hypothetical protein